MSLRCPDCQSPAVHIIDSNGAEYPETRVETYECDCGAERYTWEQCPSCGRYGR